MVVPRRRLLRPAIPTSPSSVLPPEHIAKLRKRLANERGRLARWMTRLKRAFHAMERQQRRVVNLERRLTRDQQS